MKLCKNGHVQNEINIYIFKTKLKDGTIVVRQRCKEYKKLISKKLRTSYHENEKREPTLNELAEASEKLISWTDLARKCGVSDVALRKRAKRLGMLENTSPEYKSNI